jgi:hypothetical protein
MAGRPLFHATAPFFPSTIQNKGIDRVTVTSADTIALWCTADCARAAELS